MQNGQFLEGVLALVGSGGGGGSASSSSSLLSGSGGSARPGSLLRLRYYPSETVKRTKASTSNTGASTNRSSVPSAEASTPTDSSDAIEDIVLQAQLSVFGKSLPAVVDSSLDSEKTTSPTTWLAHYDEMMARCSTRRGKWPLEIRHAYLASLARSPTSALVIVEILRISALIDSNIDLQAVLAYYGLARATILFSF